MHQLVYISTARVLPTKSEIDDILALSRHNNAQVGVTGLLVCGGMRFLQALEGPTPAVLTTFERIARDPRHFACVVLTSRSVDKLSFGEWAMAYEVTGAVPDGSIMETVNRLTYNLSDPGLKAEFRTFAELHARAA